MRPASGFIVSADHAGQRLDGLLALVLPYLSRSTWQKRIRAQEVLVNGLAVPVDYMVKRGDPITVVDLPEAIAPTKPKIIYEDDEVIVFDKPSGMLTHSKGEFNPESSIATYMARHFWPADKSNRAGIVHRLDRGTSGIIICAKTEKAGHFLQRQFATRRVQKTYVAVVAGRVKDDVLIMKWPIARNPAKPQSFRVNEKGKSAETELKVIKRAKHVTLVELTPKTGRTHQLRVHLAKLGHPILGDTLYGGDNKARRLMLHASALEILLPGGNKEVFTSQPPKEFETYAR